ncbi:MAG: hypothetical protein KAR47_05740 [Planctomycetes bacterium]|nr:hypothetical protein [Planctomycetota bacterium]
MRKTKRTEKRFKAGLPWTEADVARLVKLYPKTGNRDLAAEFGRPLWGIIGKARALELEKNYADGYRRQSCLNPMPWSSNEVERLAKLFPTTPNEEIAERIGRSLDAIANKARKMGLRKMEFWSEEEDKLLKKLYKKLSYEQLARRLGRTRGATQIRVIVLGLECKVDKWTEDEIDFLKKTYLQMTYHQIAQKLGRTWPAVAAKAENMGFIKLHHWPEADVQKLRQLYARFTARQIAEIMGCSYSAVRNKIHLLGLRKEADVTKEDRCLVFNLVSNDYQRESERHLVAASPLDKGRVSNAAVAVM